VVAILLLTGCQAEPARVDPARYDAFFLWAGVEPSAALARADTVYLLAGEVRAREPGFVPLRAVPHLAKPEVWMVVRVERLDWQEGIYARVLADLDRWRAADGRVAGLQIDFDARTRGLDDYRRFLRDLRRRLPRGYRLSITGLLDWSARGDPIALAGLAGIVDEVVIQTYQGRRTIPGYARYMAGLARLPLPYKVGLVEGGEWQAPAGLADDPEFRGYVVFLLPRRRANEIGDDRGS
jgi:hypothetical protein